MESRLDRIRASTDGVGPVKERARTASRAVREAPRAHRCEKEDGARSEFFLVDRGDSTPIPKSHPDRGATAIQVARPRCFFCVFVLRFGFFWVCVVLWSKDPAPCAAGEQVVVWPAGGTEERRGDRGRSLSPVQMTGGCHRRAGHAVDWSKPDGGHEVAREGSRSRIARPTNGRAREGRSIAQTADDARRHIASQPSKPSRENAASRQPP